MLSPVRLSVTLVRSCALLRRLKFSAIFLRNLIPWPSVDIHRKFYGDCPRGTPPPGELNTTGVANYSDFGPIEAVSRKQCKIGGKLVLITNSKSIWAFDWYQNRWPWITLNGIMTAILRYLSELVYDVVVKQLPRIQNLLLILYDRIEMICTIIQRLFEQNKLIARFDERRCIDDCLCA